MKRPTTDQLITASFPAAYLIAYVTTLVGLHPTTLGDTILAMFVCTYLSLYAFIYVWLGIAILSIPVFVLVAIFKSLTEVEEPTSTKKRKKKSATPEDTQPTEEPNEQ